VPNETTTITASNAKKLVETLLPKSCQWAVGKTGNQVFFVIVDSGRPMEVVMSEKGLDQLVNGPVDPVAMEFKKDVWSTTRGPAFTKTVTSLLSTTKGDSHVEKETEPRSSHVEDGPPPQDEDPDRF